MLDVVVIAAPLQNVQMTGMVTAAAVKSFLLQVLTVWNSALPNKQRLHEETSMFSWSGPAVVPSFGFPSKVSKMAVSSSSPEAFELQCNLQGQLGQMPVHRH